MANDFYPDVQPGDEVLFAGNPDAQPFQWRLAKVHTQKHLSCDIMVETFTGREFHHDCFHVNDPRVREGKEWTDPTRGVFKLAPRELERRHMFSVRIPQLEASTARLQGAVEQLIIHSSREGRAETSARGQQLARNRIAP